MRSQFCSKLSRLSALVRQRAALHANCRTGATDPNGAVPIEQQLRVLEQLRRNLLSNVAHELRTPLSGILGYGELLEEELEERLNDEQRSFMRQILSEGYHLRDLINTMLDMSQLATGTMELDRQPLSLELLAQQACEQYRKLASPKEIVLTCLIEDNLPFVYADPSRAFQVLGHLLTNALKFTPAGGTVALRARLEPSDGRAMVRVEVTDSGIGISPEKLPMLFSSFFQADPSATRTFGGLGLGLSLSKNLIELQGGHIWANSTPGEGSTFGFTLPVWRESDEVLE
ncbi:MAG TPA: HAMP domain-containing sensor histidine kinase [Pantanalinema sp.]